MTAPVGTAVGRPGRVWRESDCESDPGAAGAALSSAVLQGTLLSRCGSGGVCAGPACHPARLSAWPVCVACPRDPTRVHLSRMAWRVRTCPRGLLPPKPAG